MRYRAGLPGPADWSLGGIVVFAAVVAALPALPARGQRVLGIDVSAWQGNLSQADWNSVYASGRRFAFIRVTHYGASNGDPDTYYVQNMARARAAGLLVGAYHYANWSRDPVFEADYFIQYAGPYISAGYLPPMLDIEAGGNPAVPTGASNVCEWSKRWLARVKEVTGIDAGIYTSAGVINSYCKTPGSCACAACACCLIGRPLWVADWCGDNVCTACGDITNPAVQPEHNIPVWGNGNWTFWQYCSTGAVPGIRGRCDLDVFNGTLEELQAFVIDFPSISNVKAVSITNTGATITWTTASPATSQVQYGLTTAYGETTPLDPALETFHSVTLTGLTFGTTYHYRVISTDAAGQTATSANFTFTTAMPAQVLVDNLDPNCTRTGAWTTESSAPLKVGANCITTPPSGSQTSTTATCRWTPYIPVAGTYDVYVYCQLAPDLNSAVPYQVVYSGGSLDVTLNHYAATATGSFFKLNTQPLPFTFGNSGYVQVANNSAAPGKISADAVRLLRIDPQPPTSPANLTASAASSGSIQLNWSPATDNISVVGYKIYRDGEPVGTINTTSYLDSGLVANTTYSYQVAAYDVTPNESPLSTPAVSRCTLSAPPGPSSITPGPVSDCARATVTWAAVGGFGPGAVHHYRYAWTQSPTYHFTGSEPLWQAGTLQTMTHEVGTWYLHVQGCNADGLPNGTCAYSVVATVSMLGDLDGNCRVDGADLRLFRNCLGQAGIPSTEDCAHMDLDNDTDVDQDDFGILQRSFTGF